MSRSIKFTAVLGLAVVLLTALFAGQALAQQATPTPGGMMSGERGGMMASPTGTPGVAQGGMMGPSGNVTGTMPFSGYGMMGGRVNITGTMPYGMYGMMGDGMTGMMPYGMQGMMNSGMAGMMSSGMLGGWSDPNAAPLSLDQAQAAAQSYVQSLPNNVGAGLSPLEVMEFTNGFYVAVGDKSGGAFEVLVDRYNGNVSPEPGPNMMWNTKYGMMAGQQGGMMGMMGLWTAPGSPPTVTEERARSNAQKFLDVKFPGANLAPDTLAFPGYYTIDFLKDGRPAGMLSVNGYAGQVWYHTWHGQFLSEREY